MHRDNTLGDHSHIDVLLILANDAVWCRSSGGVAECGDDAECGLLLFCLFLLRGTSYLLEHVYLKKSETPRQLTLSLVTPIRTTTLSPKALA